MWISQLPYKENQNKMKGFFPKQLRELVFCCVLSYTSPTNLLLSSKTESLNICSGFCPKAMRFDSQCFNSPPYGAFVNSSVCIVRK